MDIKGLVAKISSLCIKLTEKKINLSYYNIIKIIV